jgi:hypothetical protein
MTSTKSKEKEIKMLNFTTNVAEIDHENQTLFKASRLLENMGNGPGLTADDFFRELLKSDFPIEEHQSLTMAAIAIETMMSVELTTSDDPYDLCIEHTKPTIH